jgi:hypothetical protein
MVAIKAPIKIDTILNMIKSSLIKLVLCITAIYVVAQFYIIPLKINMTYVILIVKIKEVSRFEAVKD